jgi:hypothetical protein
MLNPSMLVTTGTVNDGVIQVENKDLPDGTTVTVLAREGDDTFALNAAQEADPLAAIAEAERGEVIDAAEVLQQIRHSRTLRFRFALSAARLALSRKQRTGEQRTDPKCRTPS